MAALDSDTTLANGLASVALLIRQMAANVNAPSQDDCTSAVILLDAVCQQLDPRPTHFIIKSDGVLQATFLQCKELRSLSNQGSIFKNN